MNAIGLNMDDSASGNESEHRLEPSELALLRCIDRVEAIVLLETQQLRNRMPVDFDGFNDRKSYALFEFTRLVRSVTNRTPRLVLDRLDQLRLALAENEQLLSQNMRALQEISDILVTAVNAEASDGTYTVPTARDAR